MGIKKQTNKKSEVNWEHQVSWGIQLFDLLATKWFGGMVNGGEGVMHTLKLTRNKSLLTKKVTVFSLIYY